MYRKQEIYEVYGRAYGWSVELRTALLTLRNFQLLRDERTRPVENRYCQDHWQDGYCSSLHAFHFHASTRVRLAPSSSRPPYRIEMIL